MEALHLTGSLVVLSFTQTVALQCCMILVTQMTMKFCEGCHQELCICHFVRVLTVAAGGEAGYKEGALRSNEIPFSGSMKHGTVLCGSLELLPPPKDLAAACRDLSTMALGFDKRLSTPGEDSGHI